MKKLLFGIICLSSICFVSAKTTFEENVVNGNAYQVLKVVLDGESRIAVAVTENGKSAQSVNTMMEKLGASHAINGAFFCPKEKAYARCVGNTTDALRISEGVLYSKRGEDIAKGRTVFGFDAEGNVLPQVDNATRLWDQDRNGRDNSALENMKNGIMMPTLLQNGENVGKGNSEMTKDAKQGRAGNKSFLCSTEDKKTVYMGYVDGVSFANFGEYLKNVFGCYDAILLDNGNSKNMIYNKKYIVGPGRNLMDALVVIEKNSDVSQNDISDNLQEAITRMYEQGFTKYSASAAFMSDSSMRREQSAKFFGLFAEKIFQKQKNLDVLCSFSDLNSADLSLRENIQQSCSLGIMKGSNGYFLPKDVMTNAQAITMLMRIIVGMLPESGGMYYNAYIQKAKDMGLISSCIPNAIMTRGEMAQLLYKAKDFTSLSTANNE